MDQKNSEYGHFLRSEYIHKTAHQPDEFLTLVSVFLIWDQKLTGVTNKTNDNTVISIINKIVKNMWSYFKSVTTHCIENQNEPGYNQGC